MKIKSTKTRALAAATLLLGLGTASLQAAVTYVDAVHGAAGNTYATGGALATTTWINFTDSSNEDQNQWRFRPGANRGVGDTIYHARDIGGDTIPELTVEVPGLADGTYNIYAFFWDDPASVNNTHNLDAGFSSSSLTTYGAESPLVNGVTATLAPLASTLSYSGPDPTTATLFGSWNLHAALIGQTVVTGGSTVNVFVDHSQPVTIAQGSTSDLTSTAQVRSLFDGVGYELIPEPSIGLLVSFSALTLLVRRRR